MRVFVIDPNEKSRDLLVTRIQEALRQTGLRRAELVSGDKGVLAGGLTNQTAALVFLGPGCYEDDAEKAINEIYQSHPTVPLALVLANDVYATEAVELRRVLKARIMPLADIAQMAQFILECEGNIGTAPGKRSRGVISVVQFKGGVGGSTVAAGLAACWARNGLSVALLDLDGLNPQITEWGRCGAAQRKTVGELLAEGSVPKNRVNELVTPVEGYDGKLVVIGQPEDYRESFHFTADVLDRSPSSAEYIRSLIGVLQDEFDVIVADTGRSWGIATFAMLPLSQQVLLVTDDDGMSVRRTLDNLQRLYRESDDLEEFDLARWRVVLNAFTGQLLSPTDVSDEIEDLDIFPDTAALYTIPFSDKGRQWGAPGQSIYESAEDSVRSVIRDVAFGLIPFRQAGRRGSVFDDLKKTISKLTG